MAGGRSKGAVKAGLRFAAVSDGHPAVSADSNRPVSNYLVAPVRPSFELRISHFEFVIRKTALTLTFFLNKHDSRQVGRRVKLDYPKNSLFGLLSKLPSLPAKFLSRPANLFSLLDNLVSLLANLPSLLAKLVRLLANNLGLLAN